MFVIASRAACSLPLPTTSREIRSRAFRAVVAATVLIIRSINCMTFRRTPLLSLRLSLLLFIRGPMAIVIYPGAVKRPSLFVALRRTVGVSASVLLARMTPQAVARVASHPVERGFIGLCPRVSFPALSIAGSIPASLATGSRGPNAFPSVPRPLRRIVTSAARRAEAAVGAVAWRSASLVPARARIVPGLARLPRPLPRGSPSTTMMVLMLMMVRAVARVVSVGGLCLRLGPSGRGRLLFTAWRPTPRLVATAAVMLVMMGRTVTPAMVAALP
jgi:hypothetical protein